MNNDAKLETEATHFINGLLYKIGRFKFVFWLNGDRWNRSDHNMDFLRGHRKERIGYDPKSQSKEAEGAAFWAAYE